MSTIKRLDTYDARVAVKSEMNEPKGLLWSHKSYLQLSYVIHSHYFPFAVLIILSHSGPVYFMKAFQHPCIFKWEIRRVSKQKGNFERIFCDYRQIVRNTDSSSECQNIIDLQKPHETHLPSLVITGERSRSPVFCRPHRIFRRHNVFLWTSISCTTWGHVYFSTFSFTHMAHQKWTHEEWK